MGEGGKGWEEGKGDKGERAGKWMLKSSEFGWGAMVKDDVYGESNGEGQCSFVALTGRDNGLLLWEDGKRDHRGTVQVN